MSLSHLIRWTVFIAWQFHILAFCSAQTTSYHIGNSLTRDSEPLALEAFASQLGLDHTVGFHILESAALNEIVADPTNAGVETIDGFGNYTEALPDHEWDYVTLQPHLSNDNPDTPEYDPSTLATDVEVILDMIDLTRSNPANADTRFYIYSPWPSLNNVLSNNWVTQTANVDDALTTHTRRYYDNLINRVRDETDAEVYMVPVGEVMFELEKRIEAGDTEPLVDSVFDLYRDFLHLELDIGRYMASVTTFTTLFAEDPYQLTRPDGFFRGDEYFSPEYLDVVSDVIREVVATHEYSGVTLPLPTTTDFDDSGVVDHGDLVLWMESYGVVLTADANSDNQVDGEDYLAWLEAYEEPSVIGPGGVGDLNDDGYIDFYDLEILVEALGASEAGDLDDDGDTDGADYMEWLRHVTPFDVADFDKDRDVDEDDLAIFNSEFGLHLEGDANDDDFVSGSDFLAWQREYGYISLEENTTPSAATVPEPSSLVLLTIVLLSGISRQFRAYLIG